MGLILAVVIILRGIFLPPGVLPEQAVAIGAALLFVVVFSSVIGAFAPLVIHRLGFDPTVMAGPLMATVIDVAGLTIYFEAARLILGLG
jgi:magnesium transporter